MALPKLLDFGGTSGGGGVDGATPRNYNPASGGIPGVTSPITAITGNLGGIGGIISGITGQESEALRGQYPSEYFSTLGTLLRNVGRRAKGDISDLLPELQQRSAEQAVAGGLSGSEAENTKLLRDLGLTRYGVENQALQDLSTIQGQIPKVNPFDPTGIIAAQIAAQERADLYGAAPVPEAAYQRAMMAAGGGGGGGRMTPGLTYSFPIGPGGSRTEPLTGGYAPSIPQWGTNVGARGGGGYAPWGTFPNAISNVIPGEGPSSVADWTTWFQQPSTEQDFGGNIGYGGGAPWEGLTTDIFSTPGTDMTDFSALSAPDYTGGDYYDEEY